MNLAFFHLLLPESVQKMDDDLKEAKATAERQHTTLVALGVDMKQLYADKDRLEAEVATLVKDYGNLTIQNGKLAKELEESCVETDKGYLVAATEVQAYVREISSLKGQITKLKKKVANGKKA